MSTIHVSVSTQCAVTKGNMLYIWTHTHIYTHSRWDISRVKFCLEHKLEQNCTISLPLVLSGEYFSHRCFWAVEEICWKEGLSSLLLSYISLSHSSSTSEIEKQMFDNLFSEIKATLVASVYLFLHLLPCNFGYVPHWVLSTYQKEAPWALFWQTYAN